MDALSTPLRPPPREICDRARLSRDPRFDGLFFTAVTSTGIFCRPLCPAPVPKSQHVRYYATAAAAMAAGFRPCLRCRPELSPGASAWRSGSALVAGALRWIDEGLLDTAPVSVLAARTGVGERHLRRLFAETLGASPLQVAATRRLLFARSLLDGSRLPVTEVALAAGYRSVRRFNDAFGKAYGLAPRDMRRRRGASEGGVSLRLSYRPPYDVAAMLDFLRRRAVPGLETVHEGVYQRHFVMRGEAGFVRVWADRREPALHLNVQHPRTDVWMEIVTRVRRMFDLDADPAAMAAVFGDDPLLAALQRRFPGTRVPGGWDGFEVAVRAVLGQQISIAAARTLATRLLACCGEPLDRAGSVRAFPTPQAVLAADLDTIGLTRQRATTLRELARAWLESRVGCNAGDGLQAFVEAWTKLPGIGAWTAHYVAMRGVGHPDAFPAADRVLRQAAGAGTVMSPRALERRSAAWRPWRAYACVLLWRAQS